MRRTLKTSETAEQRRSAECAVVPLPPLKVVRQAEPVYEVVPATPLRLQGQAPPEDRR